MTRMHRIGVLAAATVFIPLFCYAAEIGEEEVTPRVKKIYLDEEAEKGILEKGTTKSLVGISEGYDNNTHLDTRRDGDAYTQVFYKGSFSTPVSKKTQGIAEYTLMGLFYADEADLNLVSNGFHLALDNKIAKDLNFITGYYLDILEYANSGNDDYFENRVEFKLKHNLPYKMFHSLGYEAGLKYYEGRHIRTPAAEDSDKKRDDVRNTAEYEIGKYFSKDMFKISFLYYNNNSNEKYLNYYDYDSYKIGASLTHLFNDKWFGYLSFARQFRDFRSRTLTLDENSKEWDRTYVGTSSLYYNMNKSLSFGLSYTYRQNYSNEPVENYSGSLISLSSYYRF